VVDEGEKRVLMNRCALNGSVLMLFALLSSTLFGQIQDFAQTDFSKADSVARLYPDHSLFDIKGLAEKLTADLSTDVEKFRAIYHWVCCNIDNDYSLYRQNKIRREKIKDPEALKAWNKEFHDLVFDVMLQKKRTVCTGYAYLVRELALYGGLSCAIVHGYGRTALADKHVKGPDHSWNAVRLNNKWYLCDATWSSGGIDSQTKKFVKRYNDAYFLTDPSLFALKHYPLDSAWLLLDKTPTLEEFLSRPLFR
jgi:transglutaminase/protease-like cytokinesis protein 3